MLQTNDTTEKRQRFSAPKAPLVEQEADHPTGRVSLSIQTVGDRLRSLSRIFLPRFPRRYSRLCSDLFLKSVAMEWRFDWTDSTMGYVLSLSKSALLHATLLLY